MLANFENRQSASQHESEYLTDLLRLIALQGYQFTTVTPVTHERFLSRAPVEGKTLRDIFGWNLPFRQDALPAEFRELMSAAGVLESYIGSAENNSVSLLRSKVRVSSIGQDLFLHSSFPTTDADAVFFGPDTYRFARLIRQSLNDSSFFSGLENKDNPIRILDIGCGSGAGGLVAVRALPAGISFDITMNDINATALDYTKVNTNLAGVPARLLNSNLLTADVFSQPAAMFDLIISNPPYMKDTAGRTYRDGGSRLGRALSVDIAKYAVTHLAPGGRLLLYTGVAMTDDTDPFLTELLPILLAGNCRWSYEEIDPDVFGEELEQPAYAASYRIAAVGLVATKIS